MVNLVSMPTDIVPYLRETLEESRSSEEADFAVYQLGRKWGIETVDIAGEESDLEDLATKATLVAVHSGLTNIEVVVDGEGNIEIKPYDAKIKDDMFLAGYVSGIVSRLLGEHYVAKVKEDHFDVVSFDEYVESQSAELEEEEGTGEVKLSELEKGKSYLIREEEMNAPISFELFFRNYNNEVPSLCLTRIFPPKIKEKYGKDEFPIFWLSTVDSTEDIRSIRPDEYQNLYKIIQSFLKSKSGVVLLQGVEFLASHNEFDDILSFIHDIKDYTSVHDGVLLVPIFQKALKEKNYNKLKSELELYDI